MSEQLSSETYESRADVRRHFEELQASGVASLSILAPVDDPGVFCEILSEASRHDITIKALHTARADFLSSQDVLHAVASLRAGDDPLAGVDKVVQCVVLDLQLGEVEAYRAAVSTVEAAAGGVGVWLREHGVTSRARLRFSWVEAALLEELAQALLHADFGEVALELAMGETHPARLPEIREQLAEFCARPIARHPHLRANGVPLCLLPPSEFRLHYRELLEQLPSQAHLFRQRSLIAELREAEHDYHDPCRRCRRRAACYGLTEIEEHPEYAAHVVPAEQRALAFVGASLTAEDIDEHQADDLVFTGPARQGDAVMAVLEGFETLVVLDGYFFQSYALTTFELLVALLENVNVFGGSSLGAVRALELRQYGMRGEGYVFDFFRRHAIAPYHAVAQTYDAADQAMSEPLVAIHRFLEVAVAEDLVTEHERDLCYARAEQLHFSELTYKYLFAIWGRTLPGVAAKLRTLFETRGRTAFDVKRQDALTILASFRDVVRRDGPDYTIRAVEHGRDAYLARLRAKYVDSFDSTFDPQWRTALGGGSTMGRARPLAETLALARAFFKDLDVVVADTSLLDQTEYYMVSVVFVPFFFLHYGNSAGSGFGETMEDALVSAYAEVLERIPCGTLRTTHASAAQTEAQTFPFRKLPFYASMSAKKLGFFVDEADRLRHDAYVECTDLMGGGTFALPEHGARLPSSCGMAAGNTDLEAILYGLYEVIEHDVSAEYETHGLLRELPALNIGLDAIEDPALASLVTDLTGRGHRIHFFHLLNRYGIPVVLSAFYDADRQLLFSGQCCRCDLQSAMAHAFHEALNGHFVSYFGSRDDRLGFEQTSAAPGKFLEALVASPKSDPIAPPSRLTLSEQLDLLLERLGAHGVEHVFALRLSPTAEFGLAVAKVVVPGLNLRTASRRPAVFYRRCETTRRAIVASAGAQDTDAPMPPLASLRQAFRWSPQHFFKA